MRMNRRDFLGTCSKAVLGGMLFSNDFLKISMPSSKPNILLIMTDDQGYETVQCYGADKQIPSNKPYLTPRLDELAATGIRFDYGFSQPLCTPSRVQIMTGQYNFRNYQRFGVLRPQEVTFGHMFKKAGYKTCIAGKWQLYGGGDGMYPDRAGFDEYCLWSLETPGSRYADPVYRLNGELNEDIGAYGPDIYTEFVMDFFEEHKDEPVFAYYPMALPHSPFSPTPDSEGWPDNKFDSAVEWYPDMIAYLDKCVGRIVDKLDELGIRENTVIIFATDNGTSTLISSQLIDGTIVNGGKGETTDAGTRVPFIVNWKGTAPEGLVSDAIVDFTDIMPTIADLARVDLPENKPIDGRSFAPLIRGEKYTPKDWTFCWYDPKQSSGKWSLKVYARDHHYKLYDSGELYYLPDDIEEQNPIDPQNQNTEAAVARLKLQKVLEQMDY